MRTKIILVITSIIILLFLAYYFKGYKSAFEADQKCHYEMRNEDMELTALGCDHDLETRQWILYEKSIDSKPAEVIKRFRY